MNIRMDELIQAIAVALDIVEAELLGVSTHHGKRIAALCSLMGRSLGMDEEAIKAVMTCALFHDNALTEYMLYMRAAEDRETNFKLHCEYGQRNVEALPFKSDIHGFVLYHHEQADGGGLFGKRDGEFPLGAGLIAIADTIDADHHLQRISLDGIADLRQEIAAQAGKLFTKTAVDAMLSVLNEETLTSLRNENIQDTIAGLLPPWQVDVEDAAIMRLSGLVARIIDQKSVFTRKHTVQIANRAWLMGGYYGFDPILRAKVYLAASLHDIGKLSTPTAVLEKPGKLTDSEFGIIKAHVRVTYDILHGITGLDDICNWASDHHEKFDGSGYSFGKTADEMDFVSRLMACTDIYQAVCEERPYHPGRSHAETMPILWSMANKGFIDSGIVKDFDEVMAEYSNRDVPAPPSAIS